MQTIYCNNMNSHRINKNKKIIYVEGINDKAVFDNIINNGWIVIPVTKNEGKKEIVRSFKDNNYSDIIAIVDKDYDNNEVINNLFYTDYNDIESTAINYMNDYEIKASSNIIENINNDDFKIKIINPVLNVSTEFSNLWRWFNNNIKDETKRPKYLFNDYNWYSFLKNSLNNNSSINYKGVESLYNNLGYNINIDYEKVMNEKTYPNEFRGHDFFQILYYFLKEKNISHIYSSNYQLLEKKFIEKSLNYEWIKRTNVYNEIKNKIGCFK